MTKRLKISSERAYLQIKKFLLHSDIYPGQKVPQVEIGARLQISVTPLREAFFCLSTEGLLAHETNRGFFVPEISLNEAKELYEVRELIEPYLTEKAVESITELHLRTLLSILKEHKQKVHEPYSRNRLQVDRKFHAEIIKLANNKKLEEIVNQVFDQLIIRRKLEHYHPERSVHAFQEHLEIYKAIEKKDPAQAAKRMREHIKSTKEIVLDNMELRQKEFNRMLI